MALTRPAPLQRLRLSPNEEVSSNLCSLFHKTGMFVSGCSHKSETGRKKDSKDIASELKFIFIIFMALSSYNYNVPYNIR